MSAVNAETEEEISRTILRPTLAAMRSRGVPFTGLLYAGLMLTRDGPKVVEFNCRFGDPETEAVLPILAAQPPLLDLMLAAAHNERMPDDTATGHRGSAVTTVLASAGYPDSPRNGDVITLPPVSDGVVVFHAGTKRRVDGALLVNGGRVMAITGHAPTFEEARRRSRDFASRVKFDGKQFRADIGWRELARDTAPRHAGAP
jgi:phosphoribosylamine-glycine ligase